MRADLKLDYTEIMKSLEQSSKPTYAIVLAGGGARGAYEAGVVQYIFSELPQNIIDPVSYTHLTLPTICSV